MNLLEVTDEELEHIGYCVERYWQLPNIDAAYTYFKEKGEHTLIDKRRKTHIKTMEKLSDVYSAKDCKVKEVPITQSILHTLLEFGYEAFKYNDQHELAQFFSYLAEEHELFFDEEMYLRDAY